MTGLLKVVAAMSVTLIAADGPVRLRPDLPTSRPPRPGKAAGRIVAGAEQIVALTAVCRATGKAYTPDRFDPNTGSFAFTDLPGDAAYDIRIRTAAGREIEGIDLEFVDSRLLRLAAERREQLALPQGPGHRFSRKDVEELTTFVARLRDFMDIRRILYIRGCGGRATMLVELMRARGFHARKRDEVIWRMELWYFQWRHGGWERVANVQRVLQRRRLPADRWGKINLEYYPVLSVKLDAEGKSKPVAFTIPARPDPSRGRVAGTPVDVRTAPHVLGVVERPGEAG